MEVIVLLITGIILIMFANNILGDADSHKKDQYEQIGKNLAQIISRFLSLDNTLWKTPLEREEVWYFLIYEINKMTLNRFHNTDIQSEIESLLLLGLGSEMAFTYNCDADTLHKWPNRKSIYSQCTLKLDNIVPTQGSSFFALSHFIKIARKNVAKQDITDVLVKKRKLESKDLDQFLDVYESMVLNQVMPMMLISIKKLFDQLCNELN